jgi:thiol-disulfide isomerase/thioredoxin
MKQLILCLALLCPLLQSCAQSQPKGAKPLTVGDTIPHIILTDVVNFPVSKIQLSSYKGKLLILDFWATWCNSCVRNFPKLDTLQRRFSKQLQFVLINHLPHTNNTNRQVTDFFKQHKAVVRQLRRIPVCTDTSAIIKQLFPHTFIPHYVWISPAGTILAITNSEAVTKENILLAISGKLLMLPIKKE